MKYLEDPQRDFGGEVELIISKPITKGNIKKTIPDFSIKNKTGIERFMKRELPNRVFYSVANLTSCNKF